MLPHVICMSIDGAVVSRSITTCKPRWNLCIVLISLREPSKPKKEFQNHESSEVTSSSMIVGPLKYLVYWPWHVVREFFHLRYLQSMLPSMFGHLCFIHRYWPMCVLLARRSQVLSTGDVDHCLRKVSHTFEDSVLSNAKILVWITYMIARIAAYIFYTHWTHWSQSRSSDGWNSDN